MKKLIAVLFVLVLVGAVWAQNKKPVYFQTYPPGTEGDYCSLQYWDGPVIVKDDSTNTGQNTWYCNPTDGLWDLIAPGTATDRTGWYILSDDMDTLAELNTQITDETIVPQTNATFLGTTTWEDGDASTTLQFSCSGTDCSLTMDGAGAGENITIDNNDGALTLQGCRLPQVCADINQRIDLITTILRVGPGNDADAVANVDFQILFENFDESYTLLWDESADKFVLSEALSVNNAVTITTAGVISYGAGAQDIISNAQFGTPFEKRFLGVSGMYQTYTFGESIVGPDGAGGEESWHLVNAGGTTVERLISTGDVNAGSVTLASAGNVEIPETASKPSFTAGFGYYYVKDDSPSTAYFEDDTGVEVQLGRYGAATVTVPVNFTAFIEQNQKQLDQNMWGSLVALDTGEAINSITTIIETNGISKLLLVLNTCSDSAGSITATGTSVHRDTKAETGSDTSVMTISGTTTDGSDTDASSNVRHAFTNAYITDKWFKGSVTFSTSDVTCTDVDVYSVAFEQVNDSPGLTFTTYDINALPTNNSAWLYSYCYILDVTGDVANVTRTATLELPAADVSADIPYRLRHGAIGSAFDGSTDGFWCDLFLGPNNQTYWEQLSSRVWIDKELF